QELTALMCRWRLTMHALGHVVPCLFALVLVAECASTEVASRQPYMGERIARPDRIIVYNFAATSADIPPWSAVAQQYAAHSTPQTAQEIEVGRKLGAHVAQELVAEPRGMGLPAVQAAGQSAPRMGDIMLIGYFESVDKGSAAERIALGFGAGAAHLKTALEAYLVAERGPRPLGSGEGDSRG